MSDINEDDGIRESTSLEGLRNLKPAFIQGGSATAGNSSQVLFLHILIYVQILRIHIPNIKIENHLNA